MYEQLRLENQLCFPLYACAKEIVHLYTPLLEPLGLTYTQYIVMMVLWAQADDDGSGATLSVKELGRRLRLDSGTLTPLLKKMEAKGYLSRTRSPKDERLVLVSATRQGMDLRKLAAKIPERIGGCVKLSPSKLGQLRTLLDEALANMTAQGQISAYNSRRSYQRTDKR
jgi:DNA-binding MarR family transcriptional regulator